MKSIILTGGTSRRFGSNKSEAMINGKTLLEILAEQLEEIVIVGPVSQIKAKYVLEDPKSGGPVAAIGAGIKEIDTELVSIFATDMPFAPKVLTELKMALVKDAAIPLDDEGRLQPLAGLYRTKNLRNALNSLGVLENRSVKELLIILDVDQVLLQNSEYLLDIDTQADLIKAIDLASRLGL